jgi:N4-gp56 family major capsid protein
MSVTLSTDLTNSVTTVYKDNYLLFAANPKNQGVWGQFINWEDPVSEGGGSGNVINIPTYGEIDLVESAWTEGADVTPGSFNDGSVSITPYMYVNSTAVSKLALLQSRTKFDTAAGEIMAINRVNSIDRILRRAVTGRGSSYATQTLHIDGSAAMSDLTSTDTVTYAFLMDLTSYAASMGIEPMKGGGFVSIVHPRLFAEIKGLTEYKNLGYYQDELKITGGLEKSITLAGITFVPSTLGRLHLGAGTVLQSATTITTAVSKGDTSITVGDRTGIVAGNYVTVGTLETYSVNPGSNLEQVLVTASGASAGAITVRANGVGSGFGLRFDHAAAESVVESYNVASIPIIGANSLIGVYGSETGKYGTAFERDDMDLASLIKYYGWKWYGGVNRVEKHIVNGKVALAATSGVLGYN